MILENEHEKAMLLMDIVFKLDDLGAKQLEVIKYLIKNIGTDVNYVIITTYELAKKANVSRKTVSSTLKLLEDHGFITRRIGSIHFNVKESYKCQNKELNQI